MPRPGQDALKLPTLSRRRRRDARAVDLPSAPGGIGRYLTTEYAGAYLKTLVTSLSNFGLNEMVPSRYISVPFPALCLGIFVISISRAQETAFADDEPFSIVFLGRVLNFYLNEEFSARIIAVEFCSRESEFDAEDARALNTTIDPATDFKNHVIAVRELIENVVAGFLGPDRIEAAFQSNDPTAFAFVKSVCRDFPKNHDMPYHSLSPRPLPMNVIDGAFPSPQLHRRFFPANAAGPTPVRRAP